MFCGWTRLIQKVGLFLVEITALHKLAFLLKCQFDQPRIHCVFISISGIISFTASSVFDSDGEEGQEGREE